MCSFSQFFSFSLPLIFTCVAACMSNIFHFLIAAKKVFMFFLCLFVVCLFVCFLFSVFVFLPLSSPFSVIHASVDIRIWSKKKSRL